MGEATVRVVARFTVQPDKVDEFVAIAKEELVAPTRKEPGCLQYELCQDTADPTRFAMIETWQSDAALEEHVRQPSLQGAVARLAPLVSEPPVVQRLRVVA